jgi:hypothetical protein
MWLVRRIRFLSACDIRYAQSGHEPFGFSFREKLPELNTLTNAKAQIANALQSNYHNERVIYSKSAIGEFVTDVLEKAPAQALGLLQGLTVGATVSTSNNPLDWQGFISSRF